LASKERVFNNRKRKVFRKRISAGEAACSVGLLLLLALAAAWFATCKDAYDPSERDISMDVLIRDTVADTLYHAPVERWVEPGAATAAAAAAPELGLFPDAVLAGGWTPSSRLQEFDPEKLYEKINGAAEQYLAFGFQMLHYLALASPDGAQEISVELYDMGAFENALGIFAAQRDPEQATDKLGPANYYATDAGAVALFGPYYLKLSGTSSDPVIREKAVQIIESVAPLGSGETSVPVPYKVLSDGLGLPFDAIAYEKSDVFQFGFAQDFWFGVPPDSPDARYFVHLDADDAGASALFAKLFENNKFDYAVVMEGEDSVLMKHAYLETFLALSRRGRYVFGVENAPGEAVAREYNDTLAGVLDGAA